MAWADRERTEVEIMQPMIEATGCMDTDERYLERLLRKIKVMLKTNKDLEERLEKLQDQGSMLESLVATREDQLKSAMENMAKSKAEEALSRSQINSMHANRLKEESRLRSLGLQLRKKVKALSSENLRLEELRRDEDAHIARNRGILEELGRTLDMLETRKAHFDRYDQKVDKTLQGIRMPREGKVHAQSWDGVHEMQQVFDVPRNERVKTVPG
eukprot:TRINITY_DN61716_c0_g1_i1.p1 TRINITY_DN61716_c0_g1~~TRINITY_DN61716_c0_g1_i1.p1  ORF type:complete len:251 (-),score=58.21 TRINITY_DN61716_c0_g1_i1:39-683(-)